MAESHAVALLLGLEWSGDTLGTQRQVRLSRVVTRNIVTGPEPFIFSLFIEVSVNIYHS